MYIISQGNYWSSNVNEVQGFVMDQEGKVIHRLFGKWHEGLYCGVPPSAKCIWRPGTHCAHSLTSNKSTCGTEVRKVKKCWWFLSVFLLPFLVRVHDYRLWALLWLHQVRHRTEWTLPWAERCFTSYRRPIQTRSKVLQRMVLWFCTDKTAESVIKQIILYFVCQLQTDGTARSPGCIYCMCQL